MSSALSIDLRERVVHAVEAGASRHKAAERFGVSLASASRWCARFARVCLHAHPRRQRWSIHASSCYRPPQRPDPAAQRSSDPAPLSFLESVTLCGVGAALRSTDEGS
ncbi:IS630 transposase-related protein [Methylorubrum extorquens]|uniref:IS630 transposase-related protein n=1 Tax=Methylorubrum extorquens TaxID=408 RepID=UPI0039C8FBA7